MAQVLLGFLILLELHIVPIASSSSCATGQHMICKTVEEALSDGCRGAASQDETVFQHRVGKAGPKGEKGDPAKVNEDSLYALVEERVNLATAELKMKIQKLESYIETLNLTILNSTLPAECLDGFSYRRKCYGFVTSENRDVTLGKARQMCQERGKKLTHLLNLEHQYLLAEEMRTKIKDELSWTQVWLEMTYSASARTLHFGNEWSLASAFRWYDRYPDRSSATTVAMESRRDRNSQYVGFFNHGPTHVTYGALCTE